MIPTIESIFAASLVGFSDAALRKIKNAHQPKRVLGGGWRFVTFYTLLTFYCVSKESTIVSPVEVV